MENKQHILIVDDDPEIRSLLDEYLSDNGFDTSTLPDGSKLEELLNQGHIDLVILDVMLPGEDGYSLCRQYRAKYNTPIIMLTARSDDIDRIIGLEIGADDYLAKPFNPRELVARIKAIFRIMGTSLETNKTSESIAVENNFYFGNLYLDTQRRQLSNKEGVVIPISNADYKLLKIFLEKPNRILSRDFLLDVTQGREAMPFDRAIDVQVSRLRQRLKTSGNLPDAIKTIRGEGYMFTISVEKK